MYRGLGSLVRRTCIFPLITGLQLGGVTGLNWAPVASSITMPYSFTRAVTVIALVAVQTTRPARTQSSFFIGAIIVNIETLRRFKWQVNAARWLVYPLFKDSFPLFGKIFPTFNVGRQVGRGV